MGFSETLLSQLEASPGGSSAYGSFQEPLSVFGVQWGIAGRALNPGSTGFARDSTGQS